MFGHQIDGADHAKNDSDTVDAEIEGVLRQEKQILLENYKDGDDFDYDDQQYHDPHRGVRRENFGRKKWVASTPQTRQRKSAVCEWRTCIPGRLKITAGL